MRDDIVRIKAKQARPGMVLCFNNPTFDITIDDVEFTNDGDVKLSVGHGGTGTEFYQSEEFIWVQFT